MDTYVTSEYETLKITDYKLTEKDRQYLTKIILSSQIPPFQWYELRQGFQIVCTSFVGVIELEGIRIVIKPKFNNGFHGLIEMLLFSEGLPLALEHEASGHYDTNSIMEMLVQIFVKEVDLLLQKGIHREYVTEQENLSLLRGRIDFPNHLKANFFTPTKIYCQYDELNTNVIENQVLYSALQIANLYPLSKETKKNVERLVNEFQEICEWYRSEEWPKFSYNRLTQHYETVHKLAYYLWKQIYVNDIYQFQNRSHYSFFVDMNELFESFVGKLLTTYMRKPIKVWSQRKYRKAIMKNGSSYQNIIPDFIIEKSKEGVIVLDTKYKPYGKRKVSSADLYQLTFYSLYVNEKQPFQAAIIYPNFADESNEEVVIDLLPGTIHAGQLLLKPISIEKILSAVKRKDSNYLQTIAESLCQ